MVTGGGTGGHLFPALAIARAARARWPAAEILVVGSAAGPEGAVVERDGWRFAGLAVRGLAGRGPAAGAAALALLVRATAQARRLLLDFRPHVVVGTGAYASVPVVLAGRTLGVPALLHEQNAFPGLANRALARWARPAAVAVGMPAAASFFPGRRVVVTGNPVRQEVRCGDRAAARAAFGIDPEAVVPLVFGGSQGAHRLNMALLEALPLLAPQRDRLQVIHATGERDARAVGQGYRAAGFRAVVSPFLREMGAAYAAADVAICRAGAITLAELAAVGKAALLVPYPHAAQDHQRRNAEAFARAGAAQVVADRELTGQAVADFVGRALREPEAVREMGRRAAALAMPEAAERIVNLVAEVASPGKQQ